MAINIPKSRNIHNFLTWNCRLLKLPIIIVCYAIQSCPTIKEEVEIVEFNVPSSFEQKRS